MAGVHLRSELVQISQAPGLRRVRRQTEGRDARGTPDVSELARKLFGRSGGRERRGPSRPRGRAPTVPLSRVLSIGGAHQISRIDSAGILENCRAAHAARPRRTLAARATRETSRAAPMNL